ncbi:uncharacterized protein LOC117900141 [Drosophila subobscura]|uniref:uncharacterized protein LOC117900141 n=1 Tax=Drosophila subobscura TaxID=7241 RepID=UPI00155AA46E|nr:uncharacterized protein LOC117900141 [Drosophila subobscura]
MRLWLLLSFPWIITSKSEENEWCDSRLCDQDRLHVLCRDKGQFYSTCPKEAKVIPFTLEEIDLITNEHNELRNKVAGGYLKLPKAARMLTMKWDLDLAKVAEAAVRMCQIKKLYCATTPEHSYTGQNEAMEAKSCQWPGKVILKKQIDDWKRQGNYARDYHLQDPLSGQASAYFLQMVRDKCNRFGCAITCFTESDKVAYQLMKCVYSCTMEISTPYNPVYVTSADSGVNCKLGTNPAYPNLCHKRERASSCNATKEDKPRPHPTQPPPADCPTPCTIPSYPPDKNYKPPPIPKNPAVPAPGPAFPAPSPPPYYIHPPPFLVPRTLRTARTAGASRKRARPRPRINSQELTSAEYDFSDYIHDVDPCDTCTTTTCNLKYHCF